MKRLFPLFLVIAGFTARAAALDVSPCFDGQACAALAVPDAPAVSPRRAAARPVVISIVGVDFTKVGFGKLQLSYFIDIVNHLKPGRRPDDRAFAEKLEEVALAAEDYRALPDDYLDSRLAQILPGAAYEIVPVRWSRDPEDSAAAVPLVQAEIRRIFAKAKAERRPVYLVAHSWGTVLAHTALNRMVSTDPEVRIDKMVTLGSPLVPSSWWMKIFMDLEISHGQLQQYVSKPRNVVYWANLWARNDWFSNEISAADRNFLEDDLVPGLEGRVKAAAEQDHGLRPAAVRDLVLLKNIRTWHFAYIFDFRVFLKTLREYHEKMIFKRVVSAELAY